MIQYVVLLHKHHHVNTYRKSNFEMVKDHAPLYLGCGELA